VTPRDPTGTRHILLALVGRDGRRELRYTARAGVYVWCWKASTWSHQWGENIAEAELTGRLSPQINMRLSGQIMWTTLLRTTPIPAPPEETFDPKLASRSRLSRSTRAALAESQTTNHCMARDIQVQNDYAGNFNVGGFLPQAAGWLTYEQFLITEWAFSGSELPLANIVGQS